MARAQESEKPLLRPDCPCDFCTGRPGPMFPMFKHLTPVTVEAAERTGSRKNGATQRQFQEFVQAADAGLRVEMHGRNYVALSRNIYEELIGEARAGATVVVNEAKHLTEAQVETMNTIASRSPRPPANLTGKVHLR